MTEKMDKLAKSLAGHDKDRIYAVVKEEEGYVFLADGKRRTLDSPKKKKLRHVQLILHMPDECGSALASAVRDSDVIHVLKLYHQALRWPEEHK